MAWHRIGNKPLREIMKTYKDKDKDRLIVYSTPEDNVQWNFDRNTIVFAQENTLENVLYKIMAILLYVLIDGLVSLL